MDFKFERRRMNVPIPPVIALACVIVLVAVSMRMGRVAASEVGVLINNVTGNYELISQPGRYFYNGMISDLHTIDKTRRTLKMLSDDGEEVRIKTSDGSDVRLDVEINYELLLDEKTILGKVVPESGVDKIVSYTRDRRGRRVAGKLEEAYQSKWIRDYSRAVVRYVFGELQTDQFYEAAMRDDKARKTESELNKLLNPHGVRVTKVIPDKFRFYDEYESKIAEKKEADQKVEEQKQLAKAAQTLQTVRTVEATKVAEVQLETLKGTLEKAVLEARGSTVKEMKEADAYAYTTKVYADAAFFEAERKSQGVTAAAEAEAKALQNLVAALAGEGGKNLVLRELAKRLVSAKIEGLPYSTSPVVQKVSLEGAAGAGGKQ